MFRISLFLLGISVAACSGGAEGSGSGAAPGTGGGAGTGGQGVGGAGGQGGMPGSTGPSAASIAFPPALSAVTADTITVLGDASDIDGVSAVRVNGVDATSTDEFATWQATVSLALGDNTLSVSAVDGTGEETSGLVSVQVERRLWFENLQGIEALGNEQVALLDIDLNAVVLFDLATGEHRVLSAAGVPDDKSEFVLARSMQYDRDGGRLIVIDRDRPGVIAVDLTTGARTVISENGAPNGDPSFTGPTASKLMGRQLYVIDGNRLIEVDVDSGNRRLVTGPGAPNDDNLFSTAWGLTIDAQRLRALVSQRTPRNILAVDLFTGERTVFSANDDPSGGPSFIQPNALEVFGDAVLVSDRTEVVAADILTGARRMFSEAPDPWLFSMPLEMTLEQERALVVDQVRGRIVAVDLVNGEQTALGGNAFPHGLEETTMEFPWSVTPTPDGRIYYSLASDIYEVNLQTGERTKLTDFSEEVLAPQELERMVFDDAGNRLLVYDEYTNQLFAIDADTGEHSVLFDSYTGIDGIAIDPDGERVFVVEQGSTIREIMLADGASRVVGNAGSPGPAWQPPDDLAWDAERGRLLMMSRMDGNVIAIDVDTGERSFAYEASENDPLYGVVSLDVVGDDVYLLGEGQAVVVHLDLANGVVSMLSDEDRGNGLRLPNSIKVAPGGDVLWVSSRAAGMIQAISIRTGERAATARR